MTMCKYTILMLLFAPCFALSQRVVTKDSSWNENAGGKFYSVRLVEYSTGESSENKVLMGDSATLFQNNLNDALQQANWMAGIAFEAKDFDKLIRAQLQARDSVLAVLGKDVTDTIAARYAAPLLATGWKVVQDTSTLNVAFSVNGQGQLRYEIQGFPVRNAFLLGRAMRLVNYKNTGAALDVFNAPGGNWFSLNNAVRLRLAGNQGLDRAAKRGGFDVEVLRLEPVTEPQPLPKAKKKKKKQ